MVASTPEENKKIPAVMRDLCRDNPLNTYINYTSLSHDTEQNFTGGVSIETTDVNIKNTKIGNRHDQVEFTFPRYFGKVKADPKSGKLLPHGYGHAFLHNFQEYSQIKDMEKL